MLIQVSTIRPASTQVSPKGRSQVVPTCSLSSGRKNSTPVRLDRHVYRLTKQECLPHVNRQRTTHMIPPPSHKAQQIDCMMTLSVRIPFSVAPSLRLSKVNIRESRFDECVGETARDFITRSRRGMYQVCGRRVDVPYAPLETPAHPRFFFKSGIGHHS